MRNSISICLLLMVAICAPTSAATFSWALIDNAGNAPDPLTGRGSVAYDYLLGTFEVTNTQYVEFLNGVDPTGTNSLQLYSNEMAGDFGGILNNGGVDGSRYLLKPGSEQEPVSQVSWFDSIRFTNWVNNGQGNSSTETGAYTLLGNSPTPSNAASITRDPSALVWLPNEDEWYKGAYHDRLAGTDATYSLYADAFITVPTSENPNDNPGAFNYFNNDGLDNGINDGFAVTGSNLPIDPITNEGPFTDVGAYFISLSQYDTFDQNGNVSEWNETLANSTSRAIRGGSWFEPLSRLESTSSVPTVPSAQSGLVGFRLAGSTVLIPEPSSLMLSVFLAIGTLGTRRKAI